MGFRLAEAFVEIGANTTGLDLSLAGIASKLEAAFSSGGATVVAGGLLAIGGAAAYAIKQGADLQEAFGEIRKTSGLAGADLEQFQKNIFELATTMGGVSTKELLDIGAIAGRLGISGVSDLTEFTHSVAMMHIAMNDIPVETLTTSIARILGIFKLGPEAALSFGSALNKLDDSSKATGAEILDVTQRLSSSAATLGMAPQQVLALATALKSAGINNEVAGTAFSQILAKMATNTAAFAKIAGLSVKEFGDLLTTDALGAVKLFVGGINQMETLDKFAALKTLKLDGEHASTAIMSLGQTLGDLDGYVESANSEWETHASILAENAIKSEQTNAQFERMRNSIGIITANIGEALTPTLIGLADAFGNAAIASADLAQSIEILGKMNQGVLADLRETLDSIVSLGFSGKGTGAGGGALVAAGLGGSEGSIKAMIAKFGRGAEQWETDYAMGDAFGKAQGGKGGKGGGSGFGSPQFYGPDADDFGKGPGFEIDYGAGSSFQKKEEKSQILDAGSLAANIIKDTLGSKDKIPEKALTEAQKHTKLLEQIAQSKAGGMEKEFMATFG